MERYLGLDTHPSSCTFHVLGESGKTLKHQVVETRAEALIEFVASVRGRRHLCFEEGTFSEWLVETLKPHVDELVVVVPKKRQGSRSDARDARTLAENLRRGALDVCVYKDPSALPELRAASRGYGVLVRDATRAKNRLRAVFRSRGLFAVGDEVYPPGPSRDEWLQQLPSASRHLAQLMARELDAVEEARKQAEEWLQTEARRVPIIGLLATTPGLGPIRSAQLVAILMTPHRFRTCRQLWSYAGLAVVTRSSSDWVQKEGRWNWKAVVQTRGLNLNRQPTLKTIFKGAALTVIHRYQEDPLHQKYQRLLEAGTKPNLARLSLARWIAAVVLAMWKNREAYDPSKVRLDKTE